MRERTSAVHAVHKREKSRNDRGVDLLLLAATNGGES